jgi:hypothetical protein
VIPPCTAAAIARGLREMGDVESRLVGYVRRA